MPSDLPGDVASFLKAVSIWAQKRTDLAGVLLIGSVARGEETPSSDIDLVLVCDRPDRLRLDEGWVWTFGPGKLIGWEDWGKVQSLRVLFTSGLEVEFGITGRDWLAVPVDPGTGAVLRRGAVIVYDRRGEGEAILKVLGVDYRALAPFGKT